MNTTYVSSCSNDPLSTSTADQIAVATIAAAGVPKRGCTSASFAMNRRSRDIAKKRRGSVSIMPLDALKIETRITAATNFAAHGPSAALAAADATVWLDATPSTPSAEK